MSPISLIERPIDDCKSNVNLATQSGAIKSYCAHISTVLILNGNKDDIPPILAHPDLLEVSNFTLRFVCRILPGGRPDWRPIIKSSLVPQAFH